MGICQTVTVDPVVEDESSVGVSNLVLSSPAPETLLAEITVENEVIEGDGQEIEASVRIEIDGSFVDDIAPTPPVGGTQTVDVEIDGVSAGTREVCAEVDATNVL